MSAECSCIYIDTSDCNSTWHQESRTKARKAHICTECGGPIGVGDPYERVVGKWDGRLSIFKTCAVCLELRDAFFCEGYIYGSVLEGLQDHVSEMHGKIASSCITPLSEKAKDVICAMIDDVFEQLNEAEG